MLGTRSARRLLALRGSASAAALPEIAAGLPLAGLGSHGCNLGRAAEVDHLPSGHTCGLAATELNGAAPQLNGAAPPPPPDSQPPQPQPKAMSKPLAPPGLSRTFYKRQLPSPPSIEFASSQGKQIFAQAMLAGTMEGFFKLIEQFRTQDEPAYCGLASLAMVLNTLSIDPRRTWKGPWRWFHEEMLDCCHPLSKVREEGITLEQAACLARCNGSRVDVYLYGDVGVEQFREMVKEACSSGGQHIIVSYSRKEFLQTGDGHFSPVGGYSEATDMVLILDTARFKYPPHWVPLEMLYNAMARLDSVTGKPRGFLRLGTHPRLDSVLFTIDLRDPAWHEAHQYVEQQLLRVVREAAAQPEATASSVLQAAAAGVPFDALRKFIAVRTVGNSCNGGVCTQAGAIELFLRELRAMPLYAAVAQVVPPATAEPAAAAAAARPAAASASAGEQQQQQGGQQQQQRGEEEPEAAASSSHAVAASSSAAPAVEEDVTAERVCMLLMMAPRDVWQEVKNEELQHEVLNWLDTSGPAQKVVGTEAEYLQGQFQELQALQQAAAAAAAAPPSAACSLQRETELGAVSDGEQAAALEEYLLSQQQAAEAQQAALEGELVEQLGLQLAPAPQQQGGQAGRGREAAPAALAEAS